MHGRAVGSVIMVEVVERMTVIVPKMTVEMIGMSSHTAAAVHVSMTTPAVPESKHCERRQRRHGGHVGRRHTQTPR